MGGEALGSNKDPKKASLPKRKQADWRKEMSRKKIKKLGVIVGLFILAACLLQPAVSMAVENSECLDCHGDESLEREASEGMNPALFINEDGFNNSVHNVNDITCVDCHVDIEELNWDNDLPHATTLQTVCCDTCHEEEGEAYQNSVHKKAYRKGITMLCYACHSYHYATRLGAASVSERENEFCLKCHNPYKFHKWLPQSTTHFKFVECTVCHAPDTPRHIHLRLFDLATDKFLTGDEILTTLGIKEEEFMQLVDLNNDQSINKKEFNKMVFLLKKKGIHASFHGELVAELEPSLHQVNRGEAKGKDCQVCHTPDSPFFDAVTMVFSREDRSAEHFDVSRDVLSSYYVHFYALGGTRVRMLDLIGIVLIAGGLAVAGLHQSARILTEPMRRRRREEEKIEKSKEV